MVFIRFDRFNQMNLSISHYNGSSFIFSFASICGCSIIPIHQESTQENQCFVIIVYLT